MKRFIITLLLPIGAMMTGCNPDENLPTSIKIENRGAVVNQAVFADETGAKSSITFVTTGPWTAKIVELSPSTRATTATGDNGATWMSIDPAQGNGAGNYTMTISMDVNYSFVNRSANIIISCEVEAETITITQLGTTAYGIVDTEEDVIR